MKGSRFYRPVVFLIACGSFLAVSAFLRTHGSAENSPASCGLGIRWDETEGNWTGIWTRRGQTNIFDGEWRIGASSPVTAVLTMSISGNEVNIARRQGSDGNNCDYIGTIATDGVSVSGTYKCDTFPTNTGWSARIECTSGGCLGAPGMLDLTFGAGGFATVTPDSGLAFYNTVEVQSDQKILFAGKGEVIAEGGALIARLNVDGSLDTSFGVDGSTRVPSLLDTQDISLFPNDGRILLMGNARPPIDGSVFARLNSDGSSDSTFGSDGIVVVPGVHFVSAGIQGDGKVLAAGSSVTDNLVVVRLNQNGSLDTTFDGDGIVNNIVGQGSGLGLQPDGKIVIAGGSSTGTSDSNTFVIRFNTDGSLDNSFGNKGLSIVSGIENDMAFALALQQDGRIVTVGGSDEVESDFVVIRFNADGSLDNAFGSNGIVLTSIDDEYDGGHAHAVAIQSDGKILATGPASMRDGKTAVNGTGIARYDPDGSLDPTFGSSGRVSAGSLRQRWKNDIAIQSDGNFVIPGTSNAGLGVGRFIGRRCSAQINSISPETPSSNPADQTVSVSGTNFATGQTVTATFPNGQSATLSGTQIQQVTPTSFRMRITLGSPGDWSIRVNNPDGGQSNVFPFTVQSGVQAPTVFSVTPDTPSSGNFDQDVLVSGANFQQGLTVRVNFPSGGNALLQGSQIQNVTPTSFIMRATLNEAGPWSIVVNNPDGGISSQFNFNVAAGGNGPVVGSINPSTPVAGGADQDVTVNGVNFQAGLRVNVTFPDGGIGLLQGTGQIQNVTPTSFKMRITLNAEGQWKIRVINPDNTQSPQFAFTVNPSGPPPTGLPTSVLSPVIGPLRVTTENLAINDGKWEFNQHGTGFHTPTGGISRTNDTKAWDINLYEPLSGNADAGKAVFAVAPGEVVSFVGTPPGGGSYAAVLIAHPNATSPVWYSGYLHMANIKVSLSQSVGSSTIIGEIGRSGATNDHLHFAAYSGTNSQGGLQSFNLSITERGSSVNPPTISSINRQNVVQGTTKSITISGTNFDASSMLEVRAPNGQAFHVIPSGVSGASSAGGKLTTTSTAITANVYFALSQNYEFTVVNRSTNATSGRCLSSICTVFSTPTSARTPVVLIPGFMGSTIRRKSGTTSYELFPSRPDDLGAEEIHRQLKDNVVANWIPIRDRNVFAMDVFRSFKGAGDFYGKLIDWLISPSVGYTPYQVTDPLQRTTSGCDTNQQGADLFLFAYDWRNSNAVSAQDLAVFVDCIANIRYQGGPIPSDFKVDIVAHSNGGLVARRYILNGNQNRVSRMVTLGTPWLGAPKAIPAMYDGSFAGVNNLISKSVLWEIAPFIRGAHELLPSQAYHSNSATAFSQFPLGEEGWDFNNDQRITTSNFFSWGVFRPTMNAYGNAGENTHSFHNQSPLQDDWRGDNTGVSYYHFVGRVEGTPGLMVTKAYPRVGNVLHVTSVPGDGTVPEISGLRGAFLGTVVQRIKKFGRANHNDLTSWEQSLQGIYCVIRDNDPNSCIDGIPSDPVQNAFGKVLPEDPHYKLKVIGSNSIVISDSYGNTTDPLSTTGDAGLRTVPVTVTGDNFLHATFPFDQNYYAVVQSSSFPLTIELTQSDGITITRAIRYVDVTLPVNALSMIELSPAGVTTLSFDSNGDGTYDTTVNPTIIVNGPDAADLEPPTVNVNETVLGTTSRMDLEAIDTGTGVQKIMYSLNGMTFQQYSAPLNLDPNINPTIYVFADDNVLNRSGLVTHNLTASNAGFSVSGPISSTVGSLITANWNAPAGRPQDDWIGLFRADTLNSGFLAKQYTGGTSTGSLSFTLPNQAGTYEFRYLKEDGFTSVAASGPISVTAPPVSIAGRIFGRSGRGSHFALVSITDSLGNIRWARPNSFGYYRFIGLPRGGTYTVQVISKGLLTYQPLVVQASDNLSNVNFSPNP